MDLNRILAASHDGNMVIIEPKENGDWMYVLGCSAPCSLAEERMGHYKSCSSITIDLGDRPLAVVALDVHYKDGKNTYTLPVAIKIERQEGHAYVDLQSRSSRILKRVVHVVGPYEMRVRLPVGEPYNGEWFSTMTDADAERWCRDGRGCRYVNPVTACRYLAEEIDEQELLECVEGETQADKLARLEKELAKTKGMLDQARSIATEAVSMRNHLHNVLQRAVAMGWPCDMDRPEKPGDFDDEFVKRWLEYWRNNRRELEHTTLVLMKVRGLLAETYETLYANKDAEDMDCLALAQHTRGRTLRLVNKLRGWEASTRRTWFYVGPSVADRLDRILKDETSK